ncbi:MAG: DNA gyrase C-terminal beta-propeller domain-containing protein, partial [Verrucomicrobiales bacterium]|nr:DNA gyrase C-terminal beta-propeller domain-containing protein [Verrucomicrobiales bacterium]
ANIITISRRGFLKRTPTAEFRTQGRGGKGLKGMETREAQSEEEESDFVEQLFSATAHDYLMFFTDTGRVYVERVFQIPEMARTSKGRSIKNLLSLRPEEKIATVLRVQAVMDGNDDKTWEQDDAYVLFATRDGTVKKTKLADFKNHRKDGIIAIRIDEGNELIVARLTNGQDEICLVTREGYCVRCSETTIRPMGRPSRGVAGIRPRGDDYVVGAAVVDNESKFLIASEKGVGKRTPFDDYSTKGRGGKGVITLKVTEKTGKVAGAIVIGDDEDVMLMTSSGQSVRIGADSISVLSRAAQGVRLMRLKDGESIQDVTRVAKDEEEEGEEEGVEAAGTDVVEPLAGEGEGDAEASGDADGSGE